MKILEKLKYIARKAYLIKITAKDNCIGLVNKIVIDTFIKIKEECSSLFISPKEQMISVLSKNIRIALDQKATAALNSLNIKNAIAEDYSVQHAKKELISRKKFESMFKNTAKENLKADFCILDK